MDNATTMYVVLSLLVIFFIVLIVFSAKTWRWLHLTAAVFVFLASLVFVWMAAATLQTQANWRMAANKLQAKNAELEQQRDELLAGNMHEVKQAEDNIRQVRAALQRVLHDRPPMWQHCMPQITGDSITLTIGAAVPVEEPPVGEPPATPPAGETPAPKPPAKHNIEQNNIVFGFLEGPSELSGEMNGLTVPKVYLGEFRVVNRTDTTITVQPTMRLTPLQQASLTEGNWTVFDNLPSDAHFAFAGLTEDDVKKLFPQERLTITDAQYEARIAQLAPLYEGKTPAEIKAIIPKAGMVMNDEQYAEFLRSYVSDGKAADAQKDLPEHVWKRVKFLKAHSIAVDAGEAAAADAPPAAFEGRNFDAAGLAMNQLLKQGKATEFKVGDEALFNPKTAASLVDSGVAEITGEVYVRPLRDYKAYYDDSFRQELKFYDSAAVLKADTITLAQAQKQADAQLTYREDELLKLQHDRDGFAKEVAAVDGVYNKLDAARKALLAKNSELYKANLQLADKIRQTQLKQAEEIYRRGNPDNAGEEMPAPSTPAPMGGAVSAP